jgi:hypothetical protein
MTFFGTGDAGLQFDAVSSSTDTSLYIETSPGGFISPDSRVTSSSEISSLESTTRKASVGLAGQLKESPWVTSTSSTQEDSCVFQRNCYNTVVNSPVKS